VVGEAEEGTRGRLSEGRASRATARFGQRRQVCRAECQEMSRVVKRRLDGVFNDINGLCGGGWTFCPSAGRVKAGARARAGRAASGGTHKKTLARIPFFRKKGFGWSGCFRERATPAVDGLPPRSRPIPRAPHLASPREGRGEGARAAVRAEQGSIRFGSAKCDWRRFAQAFPPPLPARFAGRGKVRGGEISRCGSSARPRQRASSANTRAISSTIAPTFS
jgi:hypothetical protein